MSHHHCQAVFEAPRLCRSAEHYEIKYQIADRFSSKLRFGDGVSISLDAHLYGGVG